MGWAFIGLVVYLSLASGPTDLAPPSAFDAGHVLAYFWLMFWFAQIYRPRSTRFSIGAAFCVLGVILEILQGLGGYRTFDAIDMARNALGVGIGLALAETRMQNALLLLECWLER